MSDQSMGYKSSLPDTLIQILFFPLWSPANPNSITVYHGSLGYLNLTTWLRFGNVTDMILLALCQCFSVFCNYLINCHC